MSRYFFLLLLVVGPFASFADECRLTPELVKKNVALGWTEFDQTLGAGHRELAQRGCLLEAGALVDIYSLQRQQNLEPGQVKVLSFHAGQYYAYAELNEIAATRMFMSLNPNESVQPELNWNDYVQASVAFLRQDRDALVTFRDKLQKGKPTDGNRMNLNVVKNLVKCFGKPYSWAFSRPDQCQ